MQHVNSGGQQVLQPQSLEVLFRTAVKEKAESAVAQHQLPRESVTWMAGGNFDATTEQQSDI